MSSIPLAYEGDGFADPVAVTVAAPPAAPVDDILPFEAVGRLPTPRDNVAIAGRRVEAGTKLRYHDVHTDATYVITLEATVLEGHRCVGRGGCERAFRFGWGGGSGPLPHSPVRPVSVLTAVRHACV